MNRDYLRGYAEGYAAAIIDRAEKEKKPYIDKAALIERHDGKIGLNKAGEILRAVRHVCDGGKLNCSGLILLSELEYWERTVNPKFRELLLCRRK